MLELTSRLPGGILRIWERFGLALYSRYVLASAAALALDVGIFSSLLQMAVDPAFASAIGYSFGILVHWVISSRKVFHNTVAVAGRVRTRQKALFVTSALIGLGLTVAIVWIGDRVGIDPLVSKMIAIAISFQATFLLRNHIVFR